MEQKNVVQDQVYNIRNDEKPGAEFRVIIHTDKVAELDGQRQHGVAQYIDQQIGFQQSGQLLAGGHPLRKRMAQHRRQYDRNERDCQANCKAERIDAAGLFDLLLAKGNCCNSRAARAKQKRRKLHDVQRGDGQRDGRDGVVVQRVAHKHAVYHIAQLHGNHHQYTGQQILVEFAADQSVVARHPSTSPSKKPRVLSALMAWAR